MELGDIFGAFGGFDISFIIDKLYFYAGIFLLFVVIGGIIMSALIIRSRKSKSKEVKKIGWWEEVSGTDRIEPSRMDEVEEVVIPGTTLRVFYCKKRDMWLPRFSRGVSKDLFYVLLTPTQQMVNFTLKTLTSDLKQSKLDYDHTDALWAAENTREYIKRNYKDKSVKWWQAYQGVITTAAFILIMTFSLILIIYFLRGIVQDIGIVADSLRQTVELATKNTATSGVIAA